MRSRFKRGRYFALSYLVVVAFGAAAQPGPTKGEKTLPGQQLLEQEMLDEAVSERRRDFKSGRYKCLAQESRLWKALDSGTGRCAEVIILGGEMLNACKTLVNDEVEFREYLACAATNDVDDTEQDRVVNKYNQYTAPLRQHLPKNDTQTNPR